ncbi:MAG: hypothetical protein GF355_09155 [Candidatus Eisenbacteria bacterium]|nr:hypothetical protein [Candidatus Eisenbacteria bacterium]
MFSSAADAPIPADPATAGAVGRGPRGAVLVVSRDIRFREGLCAQIPEAAAYVRCLETGTDAVQAAEAKHVRLVIVDETVVDMPAEHLVYLLNTLRRQLPVVFVAGTLSPQQERATRQAGALLYGPKGDWELLRKALHHFTSTGMMVREAAAPPSENGDQAAARDGE